MSEWLPQDRAGELRFYWSPTTRGVFYAFIAFGAAVVAIAFATAQNVDAVGWVVLAICPVVFALVLRTVRAAGIRETPTALTWRNGVKGSPTFSGQVAWVDVRGFDYMAAPVTKTLVVIRADGSRKLVWAGRRRMRWHGGETEDFARLMTERARGFGASVDMPPAQPSA